MDGISCDRCGAALLVGTNVRYVVAIDVRAAWDPPEWTADDLQQDHAAEIRRILQKIEGASEQELQDQVHRAFKFDLCPPCQKTYLKRPLP